MFYRLKKIYYEFMRWYMGDWCYFLYDNVKHEKKMMRTHYKDSSKNLFANKTAIYMANGFCVHAGLSDRFKAMTALYGWSRLMHIDFKIFHIHPFNLSDYIIPNQYDWSVSSELICYNKKQVSVNYFMLHPLVQNQINSGEIIDLERKWLSHRIAISKGTQMHFYTNMYPQDDILFGEYFQELFKPSPRVEQELQYHKLQIGGDYISVSFRFMQLLGDFEDCGGDTLPISQQSELIKKSIKVVVQIMKQNPKIDKMLVTADSGKFLEAVKSLPFVYIISGKIGHINYTASDEVNMKTFLDFFMIANAQKVYLAKSGKMYNSDFSRRAAMIYNKKFELVTY